MRAVGTYDLAPGVEVPVDCGGREATGTVVLKNLSGYELTVRAGIMSDIVGAHTYERLDVAALASWDGIVHVTPQALANNASNAPSQLLVVTAYSPGEPVSGYYPISIDRLSNVGNQIAVTSINSLKNDGNAPGSQMVESTPSDQGSSAFNLNNDGSGLWQVLSKGVQRIVAQVTRGNATTGAASIVLGDPGDTSLLTLHGTADNATSATSATSAGRLSTADNNYSVAALRDAANNRVNAGPGQGSATGGVGYALTYVDTGNATRIGVLLNRDRSGGIGGTGGNFLTWDNLGNFTLAGGDLSLTGAAMIAAIAGQATAGSFGVPMIVAQALNTHVTGTALVQILNFTAPATGMYRVHVAFTLNNGTSGQNISVSLGMTDPNTGTTHNGSFVTNTGAVTILGGSTSVGNSQYACFPYAQWAQSGTAIIVAYTDPGGTPNDWVTAVIERLA